MCVNCREEPDTPAPPVKRGRTLKAIPLKPREAATYELSDDARPCCHTTGPQPPPRVHHQPNGAAVMEQADAR